LNKKVPSPGYETKKPRYLVMEHFDQILGLQNNLITVTELALRNLEKSASEGQVTRAYVSDLSKQFGIPTGLATSWQEVRANFYRFSIVQIQAVFDALLADLAYQHRIFHKKSHDAWVRRKGKQDLNPLDSLLENLPTGKDLKNAPEYEVLEYYRQIRNIVVHRTLTEESREPTTFRSEEEELPIEVGFDLPDSLKAHTKYFEENYRIVASTYDRIGFQDFLLMNRAARNYAKLLNDGCDLTPAALVAVLLESDGFLAAARHRKRQPVKIAALVERRLVREYKLNAAEAAEVRTAIDTFLAHDPSRKVRVQQMRDLEKARKKPVRRGG
jgi:hypothetical protein